MAPSEVLLKTAKGYLHALSTVDSKGLAAATTESFHVTVAPHSTGLTGASISRDTLTQRFESLKTLISSMNIKIEKEWPPNEASNQVTLWTTASADFRPEIVGEDKKEDWPFAPETMFLFTMDESGEKVTHLFEFQDSLAVQNMDAVFGKAMQRLGQTMPEN